MNGSLLTGTVAEMTWSPYSPLITARSDHLLGIDWLISLCRRGVKRLFSAAGVYRFPSPCEVVKREREYYDCGEEYILKQYPLSYNIKAIGKNIFFFLKTLFLFYIQRERQA